MAMVDLGGSDDPRDRARGGDADGAAAGDGASADAGGRAGGGAGGGAVSGDTTLVTGGTGFVGAAVVRRLLAAGHHVRALVRQGSDRRNLAGLPVQLHEGDLRDARSLQEAVRGCRSLFHVAADYRLWCPRPRELYTANVDGTRALLLAAAAAGVERVVYTSSVATLGLNADRTPADEDTPTSLAHMIGHYKRSKYLAEEAVREVAGARSLAVVIVNPTAPIGPRDRKPTPTGRMVLDAAAGRMPAYVDTGLNVVHVDDVAEGHWLAFTRGRTGERYVLGGEDLTLRRILQEIAALTGRRAPRVRLWPGLLMPLAHVAQGWARLTGGREPRLCVDGLRMARKRMFFSSRKAERELGYRARPAVHALADAIAWFRDAGYLPADVLQHRPDVGS